MVALERFMAGGQHSQDAQAFPAVSERRLPRCHAIEEVLTFVVQRLGRLKRNGLGIGLDHVRNSVLPLHTVRIKDQLIGGGIFENGHPFRTNDDQPLFFEGMQPAHENVSADPAPERELAQRDVGDGVAQIVASLACHRFRLLSQQAEHDADVVRREAPQDVFLGPDLAHIQAVRIDIFDPAQHATIAQFLQFPDRRVVAENVANHQDTPVFRRQFNETRTLRGAQRKRFLDENVFTRLKGPVGHFVMQHSRGRNHDRLNAFVRQNLAVVQAKGHLGILAPDLHLHEGIGIAHRPQGGEFKEVPGQVPAPGATSHYRNVRRHTTSGLRVPYLLQPALTWSAIESFRSHETLIRACRGASGICLITRPCTGSRGKPKLTGSVHPPGPSTTGYNTAFNWVAGAIFLAAAALASYGMTRSLWLDEAWVANSVLEHTWPGMFYYPDWLQTSPPLFLLLERTVAGLLGPSNVAFRAYPAAAAVAGIALFLVAARRVLPPALAALLCAALACNPTVIEYSRTVKQYSGEIAASTALLLTAIAYLRDPVRKSILPLLAVLIIALPLALFIGLPRAGSGLRNLFCREE